MTTVLRAQKISRRYGRHWALRNVDLSLAAGEAVALLGANGAGKTTLLSVLATLMRPTGGDLELFGDSPSRTPDTVRAKLGYVAHATLLDDALTAKENLLYYGSLFGLPRLPERIEESLESAGLSARANDRVESFSRGMRQRLSLARALLHDPELLVLDEPFTGLDAQGCRDLAARLKAEKERGRALVLSTHQLERVLSWCDRVVVLHRGEKVEEAPAGDRDVSGWALHLADIGEGRA